MDEQVKPAELSAENLALVKRVIPTVYTALPPWLLNRLLDAARAEAASPSPEGTRERGEMRLRDLIGERIADEVEKAAAGRQTNCEQAALDILALVSPLEGKGFSSCTETAARGTTASRPDRPCKSDEVPDEEAVLRYLRNIGPGIEDATDRYYVAWAADHLANLISREKFWRGQAAAADPIDMVLFCPACGLQHIDEPGPSLGPRLRDPGRSDEWTNPPHRSHLCHGCGHIWRPADVPTNGVTAVATRGKADSPPVDRGAVDGGDGVPVHSLSAPDAPSLPDSSCKSEGE